MKFIFSGILQMLLKQNINQMKHWGKSHSNQTSVWTHQFRQWILIWGNASAFISESNVHCFLFLKILRSLNSSTYVGFLFSILNVGSYPPLPHPCPIHKLVCPVLSEATNFYDIYFNLGINTHIFWYINKLSKMGLFHGRYLNFGNIIILNNF